MEFLYFALMIAGCHMDMLSESANLFRDEFVAFVTEKGYSWHELHPDVFLFPEHKVIICLVPLAVGKAGGDFKKILSGYEEGNDILYLYEDRWFGRKESVQKRILARMGNFVSVFARKCKVIKDSDVKADSRIHKSISDFLVENHSYGDAKCKYRYALEYGGKIVAVATFSAPRPMPRLVQDNSGGQIFDSYEWVRYASVPDVRVVGGMGRLFKAFLADAERMSRNAQRPFEVMTYSDTEWSSGEVYEKLGFRLVQVRKPVGFYVDSKTYSRVAINKVSPQFECGDTYVEVMNMGSRKYLYNCSPIDWTSLGLSLQ